MDSASYILCLYCLYRKDWLERQGGCVIRVRRHDYDMIMAGGFGAAQLTSNYIQANGIRLPSKRLAYTRGSDNRPILDMLMVFNDISNVSFT